MVDGLPLATNRHKVAILVRAEVQVLGVEEPHMVRVASAAVIRRGTDTTVQHHIRGHTSAEILQRGKASTRHARAFARNALDALQRLQIEAVKIAVRHDEVRLVGATDQLHGHRIHVLLDVGSRDSRAAIGHARIGHGLPERPHGAIDAAVGARGRAIRHSSRKARQVLASIPGAVAVQVAADAVRQLGFRNLHTTVKEVNNGLFARVLDHFQTRDGHGARILGNAELRRRDGRVLTDVQYLKSRIGICII